jgi:hypothetical protein
MKKLILAFALLLITSPALAGSYTIPTSAGQDIVLAKALAQYNAETCVSAGLPVGCTQALLQASDPSKTLIGSITGFIGYLAIQGMRDLKSRADASQQAAFAAAQAAATQAQKDQACVAVGLAAGCVP